VQLTGCKGGKDARTAKSFSAAVFVIAVPLVVMAGEWGDESSFGGVAANTGGSMAIEDQSGVNPPTID
jgi:hypothetical protein